MGSIRTDGSFSRIRLPQNCSDTRSKSFAANSRKDGTPLPVEHCAIHAAKHDGVVRTVEDEVFWRKDGSSFPVEYTTAPIRNERNEITGAVVAFRDITDRKESENKIRRS